MARVWQLLVRADGDTRAAQRELKKLQRSTKAFGNDMKSLGGSLTRAVTLPLIAMGAVGVKELMETRAVTAKTEAVFKSMGDTMKVTRSQFDDLVSGLSEYSAIEGDIIQGNANVALSFKALASNPKLFEDTMKAAVDMAAALDMDTKTAVIQLGKAMQNGAKGAGALAKNGTLAKDDIAKLQAMAKAGVPMWKQQAFILAAVNKQYQGQGRNVDPIKAITLAFKDTAEVLAEMLLPTILGVSMAMQDMSKWVKGLTQGQKELVGMGILIAGALGPVLWIIGQLVATGSALWPVLAAIAGALSTPIIVAVAIVAALVAVAGAMVYAYQKSTTFRATVLQSFNAVKAGVMQVFGELKKTLTVWAGWASSFWKAHGTSIKSTTMNIWNGVRSIIGPILNIIKNLIITVLAVLRGDWSKAWQGIKAITSSAWALIKAVVSAGASVIKAILSAAWSALKALTAAAWNAIKAVVSAGVNKVKSAISSLGGSIKSLGSRLLSEGKQAGNNLIDGLVNAIKSGASRVANAVTDLAGQAVAAAKKKFKIASPSRVMADEIGGPVVDGIVAGMRKKAKKPAKTLEAILKDMERMISASSLSSSKLQNRQLLAGIVGTPEELRQDIAAMKAEYATLEAFLKTNSKKLGAGAKQQIIEQMNGLLSGIESSGKQLGEAAKAAILEGLSGINDALELQRAEVELLAAETGTDQADRLRALSRKQYDDLKAYYNANAGNLTSSEKASVLKQMTDALLASKAPEATGATSSAAVSTIPSIPRFARGGITNGISIAGEAGREAVVPLGSTAREIADRARVMQQAGLNGGVTINVHSESGDPEAIAQRVAKILSSRRVTVGGLA